MNPKCRNQYPPLFQKFLVVCRLFFFLLCSLLLSSPVQAASLQDYPLLPVNTSGPRGTLRAFLTNAENAFAEFNKSGYRSKEAIKYIQRAASTLNMSQVPLAAREWALWDVPRILGFVLFQKIPSVLLNDLSSTHHRLVRLGRGDVQFF